jgi:hypothetical protein
MELIDLNTWVVTFPVKHETRVNYADCMSDYNLYGHKVYPYNPKARIALACQMAGDRP